MISIAAIKKRLKVKDSVLKLQFKRGERAKEKEMDDAAAAELASHRRLMENLRSRHETTLSDMKADCDTEIARARNAEVEANRRNQETRRVFSDLIQQADTIVEESKYTATRNARAARQALLLIRKLETHLADVVQGPARIEGVERNLRALITTAKKQDKESYKTPGYVN